MKFEWEKPDGAMVEISHPNLITEVLNDLSSRIDTAKEEGRMMDEAALRIRHESQFGQWRWCMARFYLSEKHKLAEFIRTWQPVLSWWIEYSKGSGQEGISDLQQTLLSNLSADLRPTTWDDARKILDHHRYFKVPDCGLPDAKTGLTEVMTLANSCLDEADSLSKSFYNGVIADQATIDRFQAQYDALKTKFESLFAD